MTGGPSAFTAMSLPGSVVPTCTAGGLLVSVLLNEHNELMMSVAVQLLSNLYLIGISFLSMVVRVTCSTMEF